MDLFRLDKATFRPDKLIEGKSSLIWTERYTFNGEFELRTPRIQETKEALPEMSLICIRDSPEVMEVNTHTVEPDEKFGEVLVTRGRSFETFLENRYFGGFDYGAKQKMQINYTVRAATLVVIWNWLVNTTATDAINPTFGRPAMDAIPNLVVTDSVIVGGTTKRRFLAPGDIYSEVLRYLTKGKLGIRNIRPISSTGTVFVVDPNDGTVTRTDTDDIEELRIDVYDGVDRTAEVIFDYGAGHLVKPKYLFSSRNFKTSLHVAHDLGVIDDEVFREGDPGESDPEYYTGLDRRVGYVDAGTKPDDSTGGQWDDFIDDMGQQQLNRIFDRVAMLDATVSEKSPYVYGTHYNLGDKVHLQGKYGLAATCRVVEFIRSETKLGETSYPTMIRI